METGSLLKCCYMTSENIIALSCRRADSVRKINICKRKSVVTACHSEEARLLLTQFL
jgi:hypothetical protein